MSSSPAVPIFMPNLFQLRTTLQRLIHPRVKPEAPFDPKLAKENPGTSRGPGSPKSYVPENYSERIMPNRFRM